MTTRRCRSWRVRGWWPRRCTWKAEHAAASKWHCHEKSGHAWHVAQWYAWRD